MLGNFIPAVVEGYSPTTRLARVRIPGSTDGSEVALEAELLYPIGFRSEDSELRILAGDRVWVAFIGDDHRYPIVAGFRTRAVTNTVDVTAVEHTNIELRANTNILIRAGTGTVRIEAGTKVVITAPLVEVEAPVRCKQTLQVDGKITFSAGVEGSGLMVNNGIPVGSNHKHNGVRYGGDISNPPIATP